MRIVNSFVFKNIGISFWHLDIKGKGIKNIKIPLSGLS